jgi:hypothetical protein
MHKYFQMSVVNDMEASPEVRKGVFHKSFILILSSSYCLTYWHCVTGHLFCFYSQVNDIQTAQLMESR